MNNSFQEVSGLKVTLGTDERKEGVDFLVKSPNGKQSVAFLQPIVLIALQSMKIPKDIFGEPKENLWVTLIGFIPNAEPLVFLIPCKTLVKPYNFIFFENTIGQHTYLLNWEIKVFRNCIEKLGKCIIYNEIENFRQ